ncbi:MAG: HAMP domain-containing histidine kinase [Deltaproteobacteria bacterium]|nr:MAG: HAMP domain-containing histidine kinase [Deltaproteobacteria bacterium]
MGHPIQRIPKTDADPRRRAADRAMLLERIAIGLAHEGKNPLHNMVLHLQLMAEKLAAPSVQGSPIEKHVAALRDGIGRVDHLLKAFGEFAAPEHLPADVGAAVSRAEQLLAYEARRAGVHVQHHGPPALLVRSDSRYLGDLVAHAFVACIEFTREGGHVDGVLEPRGAVAVLELRAEGGLGSREHALLHVEAARSLAPDAACELSVETPAAGGARLSLSFLHPR